MGARKTLQENVIDTELIYAYAKTNNLTDLEQFVSGPNVANIQNIGDRCFSEGLYHAAKILFISINNNSKLALCHIHLEEFREAVGAAQKGSALLLLVVWKLLNILIMSMRLWHTTLILDTLLKLFHCLSKVLVSRMHILVFSRSLECCTRNTYLRKQWS